jgi:hypothetical protein
MQNVFDIFISNKRPPYVCNIAGDFISGGAGTYSNSSLQIPAGLFEPSLPFHRFSIITEVSGNWLISGNFPDGHVDAVVYDYEDKEMLRWKRLPCMKTHYGNNTFYGFKAHWTLFSRGNVPQKLSLAVPHNVRSYHNILVYGEYFGNNLNFDGNLTPRERLVFSFAGKAKRLVFDFQPFTVTMGSSFLIFGVSICESSAIPFGWL